MGNNDFFTKKNDWSKIKDELLSCYLKPYFQKVLMTRVPVCYIDAFAGKGLFDDGEKGSPLIAIDLAKEAIEHSRNFNSQIKCYLLERKYERELAQNVSYENAITINGCFEDEIDDVLKKCAKNNVFLYVDPFGIKSLHFDKFELLKKYEFRSIELLLNLNSFGFLREGCRLLKYKNFDDTSEGLEERESTEDSKHPNDIANMNRVANGSYWKEIIADYNNGEIDAFDAEERFVQEYCKQLGTIFSATINVPIKARKLKNMPKYRMIFSTNHKHGLIEMADNMMRRWKDMQEEERNGQIMLFEMNTNFRGGALDFDYKKIILETLNNEFIKYDDYISDIVLKYGVLCETSKIRIAIREMEVGGLVEIVRTPSLTPKSKPAIWIDWKKHMKVRLVK